MIKTQDDIKKLGRIMTVSAHPDDETFTAAGILATAAQNGQFIACVTFTRGEAGIQDAKRWPPEKLGDIRTKELEAALHILGCIHHEILDFTDGGLADLEEKQGVKLVKEFIENYRPDTILTFGPDGLTGHPDHQTVSAWVASAAKQLDHPPAVYHAVELRSRYEKYMKALDEKFDIYFNIDQPPLKTEQECDIVYQLPQSIAKKKCTAMLAMPSQTEKLMQELGDSAYEVFGTESFISVK